MKPERAVMQICFHSMPVIVTTLGKAGFVNLRVSITFGIHIVEHHRTRYAASFSASKSVSLVLSGSILRHSEM